MLTVTILLYKFAAEIGALADDFTELARSQVGVEAPIPYTWSSYFGKDTVAPLQRFTSEPLEKLRETFGKAPLSKAVLELLAPMVGNVESVVRVIQGKPRSKHSAPLMNKICKIINVELNRRHSLLTSEFPSCCEKCRRRAQGVSSVLLGIL